MGGLSGELRANLIQQCFNAFGTTYPRINQPDWVDYTMNRETSSSELLDVISYFMTVDLVWSKFHFSYDRMFN